jgi:hypothetical protein
MIEENPGEYDAIIDLGSDYFFSDLQNSASSLSSYFNLFEGIMSSIPYMIVAEHIPKANELLGWEMANPGNILSTKDSEIRFLQYKGYKNNNKEFYVEDLFADYYSAEGKSRIVMTNTPFYCSPDVEACKKTADHNLYNYEQSIVDNDVDLVISGFGEEYERTFPIFDSEIEEIPDKYEFDGVSKSPVYLTINGPKETLSSVTAKKTWTASLSSEMTFGILEVSNIGVKFTALNPSHEEIDYFHMTLAETTGPPEDSAMFRYVVYAILIICVLGFGYFIYNWIRCVMSKPPRDSDGESSDEDDIGMDYNKRSRKIVKQEMQHVLP